MTLREYIEHLNNIVNQNPRALDFTVVYGKDDGGDEYKPLLYAPTVGLYDSEAYYNFITMAIFKDHKIKPEQANAVCVN